MILEGLNNGYVINELCDVPKLLITAAINALSRVYKRGTDVKNVCPPMFYGWMYDLHQVCYQFFAVTGQQIYDRNFNHSVGSGTLLHGSAGHAYEYLGGEGRIVD